MHCFKWQSLKNAFNIFTILFSCKTLKSFIACQFFIIQPRISNLTRISKFFFEFSSNHFYFKPSNMALSILGVCERRAQAERCTIVRLPGTFLTFSDRTIHANWSLLFGRPRVYGAFWLFEVLKVGSFCVKNSIQTLTNSIPASINYKCHLVQHQKVHLLDIFYCS